MFAAIGNYTIAQTLGLRKDSKAWEVGIGGTVLQFNRTSFSNFTQLEKGYQFDLEMKQVVFGGNLYLARELNNHFYWDIQGSIGATKGTLENKNKTQWLYMIGPGIQWRLGEYFQSKYVDPYLRAGVNYMHKDFDIIYAGTEGLNPDEMKWFLNNMKNNVDKKDLIPISLGVGLNMWLNDKWGIGMQGDYLVMPYKDVANSLQGTARVMLRIGGKSKKAEPVERYIEVERIIERIVKEPVEKIVEVKVVENNLLSFYNINFEFDKAEIKSESEATLDLIATSMKSDTLKHYLITGYTDSKGSDEYNIKLSTCRAEAVVNALIKREVPSYMLKQRGVGKKIAFAKSETSDSVRISDRKISIELITQSDYWNLLP